MFTELHSSDKAIREAANNKIIISMKNDMPTIEQESDVICSSLSDPDAYIRQQASGILNVIANLYPEHNKVVLSCSTALVQAGSDSAMRVRRNALSVLAFNVAGPPPESKAVFLTALHDPSGANLSLGASGLLKIASGSDKSNIREVASALRNAKNDDAKLALLGAITKSGFSEDSLFGAVSGMLYDKQPEVQQAAVEAVPTVAPDKATAVTTLQNFAGSSLGFASSKRSAATIASRLATK